MRHIIFDTDDTDFTVPCELFTVGVMVRHKQFGRGLICSRSGDIVLIRFDDGQQKRIALHTALRAGILKLDT